jgi:hypothetical protein
LSSNLHLMIDCETFGQDVFKSAVIDFSCVVFDWNRFTSKPYNFLEIVGLSKRFKLSVEKQTKQYGYEIENTSLTWWGKQPTEIKKNITPKKEDLSLEDFVDGLFQLINSQDKIQYWWSRNNTFDPVILSRIMKSTNNVEIFRQYLPPWKVRDTKTFIDAKFDFTTKSGFIPVSDEQFWNENFKEHDSSHDIAADVMRLQAIVRAENNLEQVRQ